MEADTPTPEVRPATPPPSVEGAPASTVDASPIPDAPPTEAEPAAIEAAATRATRTGASVEAAAAPSPVEAASLIVGAAEPDASTEVETANRPEAEAVSAPAPVASEATRDSGPVPEVAESTATTTEAVSPPSAAEAAHESASPDQADVDAGEATPEATPEASPTPQPAEVEASVQPQAQTTAAEAEDGGEDEAAPAPLESVNESCADDEIMEVQAGDGLATPQESGSEKGSAPERSWASEADPLPTPVPAREPLEEPVDEKPELNSDEAILPAENARPSAEGLVSRRASPTPIQTDPVSRNTPHPAEDSDALTVDTASAADPADTSWPDALAVSTTSSAGEASDPTTEMDGVGCITISGATSIDASMIEEDETSESASVPADTTAPRPVLKLASFAGLGSNGITDDTPVAAMGDKPACSQCARPNHGSFAPLVWETMQFCSLDCMGTYQQCLRNCSTCKKPVQTNSLGKYCVRFGSNIKQFCSNVCLEEHKKGLKVCFYCQKDIPLDGDGFLAPIGDKGQFKDFCAQTCLKKYEVMSLGHTAELETAVCQACNTEKEVHVELVQGGTVYQLCGRSCFSAYKFSHHLDTEECQLCRRDYDIQNSKFVIYYDGLTRRFCSTACQNVYVMRSRKIVPCQWCKVKKYNFDMIEHWSAVDKHCMYCSVNCMKLHTSATKPAGWQFQAPTSVGSGPEPAAPSVTTSSEMPVIQSVSSLATNAGETSHINPVSLPTQIIREVVKDVMVHQPEPRTMKNKGTLAKPFMQTKGISCRPHPCHKAIQTDGPSYPAILPMACPMYMPMPMHMYSMPYPIPIPVPLPIPVPVFIPTTRRSTRGILKQIKKIQAKLPADPFEAELLAMAGALVDKKVDEEMSDDSVGGDTDDEDYEDGDSRGRHQQHAQMEPQEDFESEIQGGKIVPKPLPLVTPDPAVSPGPPMIMMRGGRTTPGFRGGAPGGQKRRYSQTREGEEGAEWAQNQGEQWDASTPANRPQQPRRQSRSRSRGGRSAKQARNDVQTPQLNQPPKERPDAKHHLKFTYGVNAWKHWVVQKNAELEKARAQGKYMKTFETDILKLRADELNYTLCMFVKEVKKPNGDAYAPDSILYLTLGIQEYLFENGRIDNIFTDFYYEPFTSALHEVVKDFKLPVNELGYFVTRIEEEHLWESKQLGAHSPQTLLNTMIYFNTKYFMLKTVDQHKKLSFSHIMKHWKKTQSPAKPNQQQKTILLRYYPPPSKTMRTDERKCYEQHENTDNPLRCPVKLYEFYLSKCPESTKSRSDMFYLQPERSCVPDSPVWYSSNPLNNHQLDKMLQRLLMVREVQEHMLADAS